MLKHSLLVLLLSQSVSQVAYAQSNSVTCTFEDGGYDDETIVLHLDADGVVASIDYESYQGAVGPFIKVANNLFHYTRDELVVVDKAAVADDLTSVRLEVRYKDDDSLLKGQLFTCEQ